MDNWNLLKGELTSRRGRNVNKKTSTSIFIQRMTFGKKKIFAKPFFDGYIFIPALHPLTRDIGWFSAVITAKAAWLAAILVFFIIRLDWKMILGWRSTILIKLPVRRLSLSSMAASRLIGMGAWGPSLIDRMEKRGMLCSAATCAIPAVSISRIG